MGKKDKKRRVLEQREEKKSKKWRFGFQFCLFHIKYDRKEFYFKLLFWVRKENDKENEKL